jgi:hypothetical protein
VVTTLTQVKRLPVQILGSATEIFTEVCMVFLPLQNPTLGILVMEGGGGGSLDGEQGSGPPKPRCEVSCRGLHGTGVVTAVSLTIPSWHQAAPCHINASTHMGLCRW